MALQIDASIGKKSVKSYELYNYDLPEAARVRALRDTLDKGQPTRMTDGGGQIASALPR